MSTSSALSTGWDDWRVFTSVACDSHSSTQASISCANSGTITCRFATTYERWAMPAAARPRRVRGGAPARRGPQPGVEHQPRRAGRADAPGPAQRGGPRNDHRQRVGESLNSCVGTVKVHRAALQFFSDARRMPPRPPVEAYTCGTFVRSMATGVLCPRPCIIICFRQCMLNSHTAHCLKPVVATSLSLAARRTRRG